MTEGFLARFHVDCPERKAEAIETWRIIARELRGYKKKAYELANLRCLIEQLPFYSVERALHIQRAIVLSIRLGNYKGAGEFTSLLGTPSSRSFYNFIVS